MNKIAGAEIQFIGHVTSCFKQKFGTPRQPGRVANSVAEITIHPQWQPQFSLQGLDQFTHLWVMFWFHENGNYQFHSKIHPPRLKGESMGVFATRSPHRPNPIGLSVVKILKVLETSVLVSGVDLIDGTPIVDIKPYLPHVETISEARGGWVNDHPEKEIHVSWADGVRETLEAWALQSAEIQRFELAPAAVAELIEDMIAEDPRPLIYRGFEGEESQYRNEHAIYLFDGDVHFRFLSATQAEVTKIVIESLP